MTKLLEWLAAFSAVLAVWMAFVFESVLPQWSRQNKGLVLWAPFFALVAFGVYCVSVIAYRVATFNDCQEAAAELKLEIEEARADLRKKGLRMG